MHKLFRTTTFSILADDGSAYIRPYAPVDSVYERDTTDPAMKIGKYITNNVLQIKMVAGKQYSGTRCFTRYWQIVPNLFSTKEHNIDGLIYRDTTSDETILRSTNDLGKTKSVK